MKIATIVKQLEWLSERFRNNLDEIEDAIPLESEADEAVDRIRQALHELDILISEISGKPPRDETP